MKNFKVILTFLICTSCLSACKKVEIHPSDLTLPDITAEGKGTFGFILNGDVWAANGTECFIFTGCSDNPYLNWESNSISFGAFNKYKSEIDERLNFTIHSKDSIFPSYEIGRYYFSDSLTFYFAKTQDTFYVDTYPNSNTTPDTTFGYIDVTHAPNVWNLEEDSIIAGTFDFTFIKDSDTFEFKQGRFDVLLSRY